MSVSSRLPLICVFACFLGGCASFVSQVSEGHPNRKQIAVPPRSRTIMLCGDDPTTYTRGGVYEDKDGDGFVTIPRGAGLFRGNVGRVEINGEMVGVIRSGLNPWLLGNFIPYNGVLVGFGVDFVSGGAYNPVYRPSL